MVIPIVLTIVLSAVYTQDLVRNKSKTNLTQEQEPKTVQEVQEIEKPIEAPVSVPTVETGTYTPEPIKTPQKASTQSTETYRPLVEKYFSGTDVNIALAIMQKESGGNTNASSPTDDHGLMQIHAPIWCNFFGVTREQLKDPETNIRLASIIKSRSSWTAWTTFKLL